MCVYCVYMYVYDDMLSCMVRPITVPVDLMSAPERRSCSTTASRPFSAAYSSNEHCGLGYRSLHYNILVTH